MRRLHEFADSLRRRWRRQEGISIIEVVVASMLLVLGALAIFKIVDASIRTSYRAEQSQVASNLLQREMEKIKAMPVSEIAVSSDCAEPLPEELAGRFNSGEGTLDGMPLIGGGTLTRCETVSPDDAADPGEQSADVEAAIYRMVTWYDPDLEDCIPPPDADGATEDTCGMRRIIVGVQPETTAAGGERGYREMQADVMDLPPEPTD